MQPVDPAHQFPVFGTALLRLAIDGATADVEQPGLKGDSQVVIAIDHLLAL